MSDTVKKELQSSLNEARRARDRLRTVVLSTALSDIRNREIQDGEEAGDDVVQDVLARAVKQRREAAEQMRHGDREDLAEREEAEAQVLEAFLPPPLTEEEVREMIREIVAEGVDQMGPLMGRLMPRIKGRFEGKEANRLVREELGG